MPFKPSECYDIVHIDMVADNGVWYVNKNGLRASMVSLQDMVVDGCAWHVYALEHVVVPCEEFIMGQVVERSGRKLAQLG